MDVDAYEFETPSASNIFGVVLSLPCFDSSSLGDECLKREETNLGT
jgi:hypothetical protein